MFKIGDNVIFTYVKTAKIIKVHHDDAPYIYYTIKLDGLERYPNTSSINLHLIKKNGELKPYDKYDKVLYIKNIDTKIYEIIRKKENILYKIKYNGYFKIVKENKLTLRS